tara:strand:- start:116 stop:718 length:603 start_codon:yes stop_codon:yes gene_type:complete
LSKLNLDFYQRDNVVEISKELLGKTLFTNFDDKITAGIIVETEAYAGITDRASHAFNSKRTKRNQVMYKAGGIAYVYLCYGMHHLFNIVTNKKNIPHAVLIRAIEPIIGLDIMLNRRLQSKKTFSLTSGPGCLSKALGITTNNSGISLLKNHIWIEGQNTPVKEYDIVSSSRVGIQYAKEDANNPWRFQMKNNPWTSPAK